MTLGYKCMGLINSVFCVFLTNVYLSKINDDDDDDDDDIELLTWWKSLVNGEQARDQRMQSTADLLGFVAGVN